MARAVGQQQHKDLSPLLAALKSCSAARDLERGKAIHAAAIQSSDDSNIYVANSLVAMYSKCGSLADAKSVFDRTSPRTVASWNSLMLGYVENGHGELALELLSRMTLSPNARSFATAVRACGILAGTDEEKLVRLLDLQSRAGKCGLDSDVFVATSLVDSYAKCRRIESSCKAFQRSSRRDVVLWTALILGCVENQENDLGLQFFSCMVDEGCKPNARTFVAAVKACGGLAEKEGGKVLDGRLVKMEALERGYFLQSLAARSGFDTDAFLACTLIDMFAKCGSMVDARRVFDRMACVKDVVLWNALMLGYVENGEEEAALEIFSGMVEYTPSRSGCEPNQRSFVALFKACSGLAAREGGRDEEARLVWLEKAMAFHSRASRNGFATEMFVANSLVDLYARCGSMVDARRVFDGMEAYDFVSWNTLLVGYVENGQELLALELVSGMESQLQSSGVLVTALKACVRYAAKEQGQQIDGRVLKLDALEKGMALHSQTLKNSGSIDHCTDQEICVSSSLVEMYASCGSLHDARRAFDRLKRHDVVSWSTLIDCFAENGQGKIALELFSSMVSAGFSPNAMTYVAALKACASLVDLKAGSSIHAQVCRRGIEDDPVLATCLVDFFSKSGAMDKAQHVFDSVRERDLVIWTALISGYSHQGDTSKTFELFDAMQDQGFRPNGVTYVTILTACSHAGLVEKGQSFFEGMSRKHGICPEMEHYMCVVDMLGRANKLEEALAMAKEMPFQANEMVWTTVLGACKKWGNVEIGKAAFEAFVEVGGSDAAAYTLMANLWKGTSKSA